MRVLVTGIAGFIGSHLAERLVARGDDVVGLDNFDLHYDPRFKDANLRSLRERAVIVTGDVLSQRTLERAFAHGPFDAVVHLAALPSVRASIHEPWRFERVNVEGTAQLAYAVARYGMPRLVFASSGAVYGDNPALPHRETDRVDAPASPFGASKRGAELLLRSMNRSFGLTCTILRYYTVYGPRQPPTQAVHAFCRAALRGRPLELFGEGSALRDLVHVDDVVDATLAAVERPPTARGVSVYNVSSGIGVRTSELAAAVGVALGKRVRLQRGLPHPGEVVSSVGANDAARRELGFAPRVALEDGLADFARWARRADRGDWV
ncbi:MAG: NAD-dependent epimerase/dehydratase family protein [Polyangiaceae bacterium]|nr:NAD-dependent epimerase/dehydratase family protein [Polyangiaceae bacterium]